MFDRPHALTRNTVWTPAVHHGGLVRTMAEIQAEGERTQRMIDVRNNFVAKDVC